MRECIHIEGRSVNDIFGISCVERVQKDLSAPGGISYTVRLHDGSQGVAITGDWLCFDEAGGCHVLTDGEYRRLRL